MHNFLKKTLSLSLALSLLAGAAGATTLTGLETETVERNWESSLFFPRMEALTGVSMDAHAVSDEAQYANLIAAMRRGASRRMCSARRISPARRSRPCWKAAR